VDGVTHMWLDVGIVALFAVGVYCFAVLTGWQTRLISRRTNRRAEDMYDQYAGSRHKQRSAREPAPPGMTTRPGRAHPGSGTSAHR
jgi:hypothetical protein